MPNTPNIQDPEALDALMPWSPTLPSRLLFDVDAPRIEPDEPIVDVDPHAIEGALEAIDSASSLAGDLSAKS